MIEVKEIVKKYGDKTVLQKLSLSVEKGEIVLIEGESGVGKTTLLNIISGIDLPDEGSVVIEGKNIVKMSEDERAKLRLNMIGIIFQTYNLIEELNVEENIALPLRLAGKKWKEKVEELMEFLDISDLRSKRINMLSGGERQRVAIARALANDPRIILADEPTSNLDDRNTERVIETLRRIREKYNATIVIASHDPRIVKFIDKKYLLENGKLMPYGDR